MEALLKADGITPCRWHQLPRIAAAAAALCVLAAGDLRAQNPEKFERVVPAKPQPAAPKPAAPAGDALVKEMMRKAEAREKEDGFCGRAKWPEHSVQSRDLFYETAKPGDVRLGHRSTDGIALCGFNRMLQVFVQDGQRCIRLRGWACWVGADCKTQNIKACRDTSGVWKLVVESENK